MTEPQSWAPLVPCPGTTAEGCVDGTTYVEPGKVCNACTSLAKGKQ